MDVDNLRERVKGRLRELGISAREASRRAGFNVGYVGDILDGRSKSPDAERILKLAESLDMDAADLLGDSRPVAFPTRGESLPLGEERRMGGRMLDLYGAPMPINRQFVPFHAEPIGRVPCPPFLLDVPEAFAATVANNASAPRFFAGEMVFVNPSATPARDDWVWIRRKDESVGIGLLSDIGAESFTVDFLGLEGSAARAEIPFEEVHAIKRIVAAVF